MIFQKDRHKVGWGGKGEQSKRNRIIPLKELFFFSEKNADKPLVWMNKTENINCQYCRKRVYSTVLPVYGF